MDLGYSPFSGEIPVAEDVLYGKNYKLYGGRLFNGTPVFSACDSAGIVRYLVNSDTGKVIVIFSYDEKTEEQKIITQF